MRALILFAVAATALPGQSGFHIDPLNARLLAKVQSSTWHAVCPVSPADLRLLTIAYRDYNNVSQVGELIVHKDVAGEVLAIFQELYRQQFRIAQIKPVEDYGGSDDRSMEANNTSAFNCRDVTGQPGKFSNHSWGRAIDINPLTNPYIKGNTVLPPEGRGHLDRTHAETGSIQAGSPIVKLFQARGWTWGGSWTDRKDYQHFEKPEAGR